ncbi:MAG: PspC domain-containing protein [Bacteroidetes bacterium]|nr:PspC domain-containing protein [Bacteroidota bacterium]
MNKVFNINLGGYPFTIDEDAYEHLSNYLKTIHNHFRQSEGYEEITSDIETRLAEIFREDLGNHPIVSLRSVEDAIAIMGTPEDFGAEPLDSEEAAEQGEEPRASSSAARDKEDKERYRTGRRLFRNTDDEQIGGVCSGIAAYFGIEDPLWVRLAFVVLTITGGFGIPLYLILWAILPSPETASDRLAMKGQPINVSNIGKIIEEEMENFSSKMANLGDEISDWGAGTGKKKRASSGTQVREGLAQATSVIGKILKGILKVITNIWKPILFIVMLALLLAFAASWIGAIVGFAFLMPFMDYLMPGANFLPMMGLVGVMLAVGIPILLSALGVGKRLFRFKVSPYVRAGLGGIWVLSIISMFFTVNRTIREFDSGHEMVFDETILPVSGDTLYIKASADETYRENLNLFGHTVALQDKSLSSQEVELNLIQSDEPGFQLQTKHYSRGNSIDEARSLAEKIDYRHWMEGNTLYLDKRFAILKGNKWRSQEVRMDLKIPKGKIVVFENRGVDRLIHHVAFDRSKERPWDMSACSYWKMTDEGLICPEYIQSMSDTRIWDGADYSRIQIEGNFDILLKQADTWSVKLEGREDEIADVDIQKLDDLLEIVSDGKVKDPIRLEIQLPGLELIEADHANSLELFGFEGKEMDIWLEEVEKTKAFLKLDRVLIRQSGGGEIDLRGQADKLELYMGNRGKLDAKTFQVREALIDAEENNLIQIQVTEILKEKTGAGTEIELSGGATREEI